MNLPKQPVQTPWYAVKEAVFPFNRFAGVDPVLGPEMKSTGEVMGMDATFELAYWKSQLAAGQVLPLEGTVFLSAKDRDKPWMVDVATELHQLGFKLLATEGTAKALREANIETQVLSKISGENGPNVVNLMKDGKVDLIINTPSGLTSRRDEASIRSEAILRSVPLVTTQSGARASVASIRYVRENDWDVKSLQDYHQANTPHLTNV